MVPLKRNLLLTSDPDLPSLGTTVGGVIEKICPEVERVSGLIGLGDETFLTVLLDVVAMPVLEDYDKDTAFVALGELVGYATTVAKARSLQEGRYEVLNTFQTLVLDPGHYCRLDLFEPQVIDFLHFMKIVKLQQEGRLHLLHRFKSRSGCGDRIGATVHACRHRGEDGVEVRWFTPYLPGKVRRQKGAVIHPFCHLSECKVDEGASVGPYARLRGGTEIFPEAKVGNFVEMKNTRFGQGSKAMHLTYLGDADVGERVNVGAGTITCNYDGVHKHPTTIEDGVFIGSEPSCRAGDGRKERLCRRRVHHYQERFTGGFVHRQGRQETREGGPEATSESQERGVTMGFYLTNGHLPFSEPCLGREGGERSSGCSGGTGIQRGRRRGV